MKTLFLFSVILLTAIGCKKGKSTSTPAEIPAQSIPCFNSQYSGTYIGSGTEMSSPFTSGTLTILIYKPLS
jgi:hypothetical protein